MLEIAIMVEGQNGLNWKNWQNLAIAVEECGFAGLYRSDHFTNASGPDLDSLEMWTSLTWLASHTKRIAFGPLVSPVSFRHPAMTARMAIAVDNLSNGRLTLGLGAGWQEREHNLFGFDLLNPRERFDRFEEGLEVIVRLLKKQNGVDFSGEYYQLRGAALLPQPAHPKSPRILIGGNGQKRTPELVARYADEWNALFLSPTQFKEKNDNLNTILQAHGRDPQTVNRSMMTGLRFERNWEALNKKLKAKNTSAEKLRERGILVVAGVEIQEELRALEKAGVQRVMLQWLELENLEGLADLAEATL